MRILLFTGKGGVGKTTTAAATALACAEAGARTLVVSTDPAHSLADAYGIDLGDQPGPIPGVGRRENRAHPEHGRGTSGSGRGGGGEQLLWGQQLDASARMEDSWGEIQGWLHDVFSWAGVEAIEAEELAVLPGLDEIFALADIKAHATSGAWDTLVVDCAPTAETIRLLSLPDVLSWYMERFFPLGRRVNKVVAPVLGRLTSLPVAGDDVFGAAHRFYDRLDGVKELLTDPATTSVRLVVNPERMVIAEARRTYTYLSLFGYRVDCVVANRLLPAGITDPWFDRWRALHAEHLAEIEAGFAPLPVLTAELADDELVGVAALRRFAAAVYPDGDPAGIRHTGDPLRVVTAKGGPQLVLALPAASRDDLDLGRSGDELLVRVGPYRRAIVLPDSLRRRSVTGATLRGGVLRVSFST